jgi:hypothetical protein
VTAARATVPAKRSARVFVAFVMTESRGRNRVQWRGRLGRCVL